MSPRTLDFIIIGVQKGGTTSLHHHLSRHPEVYVPESKEVPFFTLDERYAKGVDWLLEKYYAGAPEGARLGKATPQYMLGSPEAPTEAVAHRIARTLPDVKLIALLREPISRAVSQWRMAVRKGHDARSFERAARDLLHPRALDAARRVPKGTNSYLTQGEYGRILSAYAANFPREQLLVERSADLSADTEVVFERICRFLGVDAAFRPPDLATRYHQGGKKRRVSPEAAQALKDYLDQTVFSELDPRSGRAMRETFGFWFETSWNVEVDQSSEDVPRGLRKRLDEHFAADAALLRDVLGIEVPWLRPGAKPALSGRATGSG